MSAFSRDRSSIPIRNGSHCVLLLVVSITLVSSGCRANRWSRLRRRPFNPLAATLSLESREGARPTDRTRQLLRRYDIAQKLDDDDPQELLADAQRIAQAEPTSENIYAVAELAYVSARRVEKDGDDALALDMYGAAVGNAYLYLFDEAFDRGRNPYDPHFRRACDLYNGGLEGVLRIIRQQDQLKPGGHYTLQSANQRFDVTIANRGTWEESNFGQLQFVSDFEVQELTNEYRTYGLGVPMIAEYASGDGRDPAAEFYPPGMSFPITAFVRVDRAYRGDPAGNPDVRHHCVLELHDPLKSSDILVNGRLVPLETDLTTPLAHALDNPAFKKANVALRSLRDPEASPVAEGLYMLEPYDPHKIPVVMVHGFWSSLVTWMEMFNDLRGSPEIRDHYQFWFYLYPTGQPFWYAAGGLRDELQRARQTLDPDHHWPSLDQMVLVGHSMGGLIARMQAIQSQDAFWRLISDAPISQLRLSPQQRDELQNTFLFSPNPSVRRVVTIAAPHHGSNFSNAATQWLGRKLINPPRDVTHHQTEVLRSNGSAVGPTSLLHVANSVESLATTSPALPALLAAPPAPWIRFHNIVALVKDDGMIGKFAGGSDGVVPYESAHIDGAVSEVVVTSDHVTVHRKPRTVLEVRRILLKHLNEVQASQPMAHFGSGELTQRPSPLSPTPSAAAIPVLPPATPSSQVLPVAFWPPDEKP